MCVYQHNVICARTRASCFGCFAIVHNLGKDLTNFLKISIHFKMIGTSIRLRLLCQRLPALRRTFHSNAPFVINPNRLQMQSSILQRLKRLEPLQIAQLRLINTTDKNKDHHQSIDVFDPEFLGKKKPSGPKTAQEFADVNSQKVYFVFNLFPLPKYLNLLFKELDFLWI